MTRLLCIGVALFVLSFAPFSARAETIENLRAKIAERESAIAELEKEIIGYQDELETVGKETQSLQSAVRAIDVEQKKIGAEIRVAENKITAVSLAIEELSQEIGAKERRIGGNREAIAETIRAMRSAEDDSLVEGLLANETLSAFWGRVDTLERFQQSVRSDLAETQTLKAGLEESRAQNEANRRKLVALRGELSDRRALLAQRKKERSALLTATKNKESEYRKLLNERVARRNAFESELLAFESELKFAIDPSRLPETGAGVLQWPLDVVKITQKFGSTSFSRAGGYNGQGHNGIDLRAPNGTPVRAAQDGVVKGVGNTDAVCPGASYGKWVLIEHGNGLSTLYAHFSLSKVSKGQTVNVGEIIGYSGDTGYATGPHLHFTVYATQGVRIMQRKSAFCRGTYQMPVADLKAYLNPLSYL